MPWDERRPLILAASAVLCFANSYDGRFVFDDAEAIVNNKDVVGSAVPWYNVIRNDFWGTPLTSNVSHKSWRPLTTTTFRLNFLISGLNPIGYHLINVLLHAVVVLLLYEVVKEILCRATKQRRRSSRISFWCSLLFSVHPVHTECVASVVGRAELLCAVFFLLSVKSYLDYSCNDEEQNNFNTRKGAIGRCIIYSTLSILSKEQGITSLAVCLLYDVLINSRHDLDYVFNAAKRRANDALNNNNTDKRCSVLSLPVLSLLRRTLLVSICLIIQFILRMWIIGFEPPSFTAADNPASFHPNLFIRSINYNYLYTLNAWLLINPSTLCFDYSMGCIDLIEKFFDYRLTFVVLFWFVIIWLFAQCRWCNRSFESICILLALIWTIVTFLPASNVFFRVGFVLAERVLYLPSVGYCLLAAMAYDKLRRTALTKTYQTVVTFGFTLLLLVFCGKSIHRSGEWKNETSLFTSGARVCPTNAKVHYNLGKILNDFGSREEAQIAYRKALQLHPKYEQAMNNLANLYKDSGQYGEAEKLLEKAVEIRPNFAAAWMNLGIVKAALKKYSHAERSYSNALYYRPNYADCLFNLGNLYLEMGRESDALNAWLNATRLKPNHEKSWINIILLLDNKGDVNAALHYGFRALHHIATEPGIYFAVANCLGKLERFAESENYFQKALKLDPTNANYHNNLGVLYHRWKKFDLAESMYVKAIQLNPQLEHAKEHLNKVRKILTK